MESTIQIEINKTTKRFRVVDATDYVLQNVDVVAFAAKGLGTIRFEGSIVAQKLTTVDPLVDLSAGATTSEWFNCVLDSNNAIAYGVYSIDDYSVRVSLDDETCDSVTAGTGGAGGFTIDTLTFTNVVVVGDSIIISDSLSPNSGVKTVSSILGSTIFVSETVNAETPVVSSKVSFDITQLTGSASGTYVGCEEVSLSVSFVSDCERGLNGSVVVTDTTDYDGQLVVSKELTLFYPSWTETPEVASVNGVVSLSAIATGTYTVTSSSVITLTNGDLLVTYESSFSEEYKVSCSGSLCGLLPCISNLLQVHSAAVKKGVSPYQFFVDSILLNYVQAIEYKKCGEFDKYQEKVQAIDDLLDSSGCECSCCDDDELIWVLNIDPTENNILTQLQVAVDALILNVSNLTATSEEQTEAISGLIISLNNIQTSLAVLSGQVSVLEAYYPVLQADIATLMESVFGTGGINEQLAANTLAIDSILTEIGNISSYISTQISIINDQFIGVNSQIASIQSDILALESNVQALQISAVMSVSGLDVDNTNPQNPVVRLSVDGATITGQGTPASPLVANFTPVDSYLKYAAILSAEGSTDPVLTVLENTIGAIVWTRSSAANFRGTLSGAYTASKTMVFVTPIAFLSSSFPVIYTGNRASSNVVDIAAYRYNGSSWGLQDGFIYGCYIEIRVYP
jgi:hypothetical protein